MADIDKCSVSDPGTPDTLVLEDPFSPRTIAKYDGDFARLIPVNRPAALAFDAIAEHMRLDPEWNPHARQFIHVDEQTRELSPECDGSDTQTDEEQQSVHVRTGYYKLNLERLPDKPMLGWVLGGGRNDLKNGGVDYYLTLEKGKHRVHGRHARLMHRPDNGALMLIVDKGKVVFVNGNEKIEGSQRVVGSIRTALSLGHLTYDLEFTQLNESRYREQLRKVFSRLHPGDDEPPSSLEITPSANHYDYHNFIIQTPFAFGASGVVSAGLERSTGMAVAVKRLKRTQESMKRIQLEVGIYKKIGDHPNLCHLMADLYSSGTEAGMGRSNVDDVHLIHSPLAKETFVKLSLSKSSYQVRIAAFHQVLKGLAHLHYHGIMHRDIKPTNLMVVSYDPVHTIIIDYGSATMEKTSKDHYCDVWSMGLSGYQLFHQESCKWKDGMSSDAHADIVRDLRSHQSAISKVLQTMLAWHSSERLPVDELLTLAVWSEDTESSLSRASSKLASAELAKRQKQ